MRMRGFATGLAVVIVWAGACLAANPVVSNVRASQRGGGSKLVDIYYDVADSAGDRLAVSVTVTTNGAAVPATTFQSGSAVGAGVVPGSGKRIVWDAGKDWAGRFSESVRVAITAGDGKFDDNMTLVSLGTFTMGDSLNDLSSDSLPLHSLSVSAFYMDKYEVTKALWNEVANWATNRYDLMNVAVGKASNHPIYFVNWWDCVKWCNARSEMAGLTPCYTQGGVTYRKGRYNDVVCNWSAGGYRLPTEAEWEMAARGGLSGKRFPWGDTITHSQANYCSSTSAAYDLSPTRGYHPDYDNAPTPYTSPVGSFAPNGYGLYDMSGNVWEWCWDWFSSTYYSVSPGNNPRGPSSGTTRVKRGGAWSSYSTSVRVDRRSSDTPDSSSNLVGFRTVR